MDTAVRGISLQQLQNLAEFVQTILAKQEIVDNNPYSPMRGRRITWDVANMYHVCEHFIMPITKTAACSYVEIVASEVQKPVWMVSHAWSTPFEQTLMMLRHHAGSRCST